MNQNIFIFTLIFLGLNACNVSDGVKVGGSRSGVSAAGINKNDFSGVTNSLPVSSAETSLRFKKDFFTTKLTSSINNPVVDFIKDTLFSGCVDDPVFIKNNDGTFRLEASENLFGCVLPVPVPLPSASTQYEESIYINHLIVLDYTGKTVDMTGLTLDDLPGKSIAQVTFKFISVFGNLALKSYEYRMMAATSDNNAPCRFNLSTVNDCIIAFKEIDSFPTLGVIVGGADIEIFEYQNTAKPAATTVDSFFASGAIRVQFNNNSGTINYPGATYTISNDTELVSGKL